MTTNPVISKLDIDEQGKTYYSNVNDHDMALKQFNANLNFSKGLLKNSVIIGPAINYSFSSFSEILNNTLAKNKISNFSIGER
ncbi:hypothetical protein KUH03_11025 [Sphingobacterium sp. E70]|uniref:hypothetical protein n=1 Tax=Sphingobacterium sp. E70 TaxID=2853439 RepID=UPI00211CE44B|nr:hypothetical protein [Sphingobacterium sp. E70]ULT27232.1 hypothetical protein KUH03_11025 [Sphingobacterium sp. E70]